MWKRGVPASKSKNVAEADKRNASMEREFRRSSAARKRRYRTSRHQTHTILIGASMSKEIEDALDEDDAADMSMT